MSQRVLSVLRWPLGGIRTYVLYHYPPLLAADYRFTFVGPSEPMFREFCNQVQHWPDVAFAEAPSRNHSCNLSPTVRRLLRGGGFDLVHSHGLTAAAQVEIASLRIGVPHVTTLHDVFRKGQLSGPIGVLKLWVLGQLLARCDAIVSVSRDAQDNLLEYIPKLARGRTRLVPVFNGIDTARFAAESNDDLRERLGIGRGVFLIGFLGRFMEQKGFLPLLEALQMLRQDGIASPVHLVAVGSGDYQREYAAEAQRKGLEDCVTFLPFVTDVAPTLRQLDLMVMPSLWEACPLLPMEAMCAGTPVLGSDCIGLREVLCGTPSRSVPAGDAPALSEALRQSIEEPWTADARRFAPVAQERFSAERSAEQLRHVFEDVLNGRERKRGATARSSSASQS